MTRILGLVVLLLITISGCTGCGSDTASAPDLSGVAMDGGMSDGGND